MNETTQGKKVTCDPVSCSRGNNCHIDNSRRGLELGRVSSTPVLARLADWMRKYIEMSVWALLGREQGYTNLVLRGVSTLHAPILIHCSVSSL